VHITIFCPAGEGPRGWIGGDPRWSLLKEEHIYKHMIA